MNERFGRHLFNEDPLRIGGKEHKYFFCPYNLNLNPAFDDVGLGFVESKNTGHLRFNPKGRSRYPTMDMLVSIRGDNVIITATGYDFTDNVLVLPLDVTEREMDPTERQQIIQNSGIVAIHVKRQPNEGLDRLMFQHELMVCASVQRTDKLNYHGLIELYTSIRDGIPRANVPDEFFLK